MGAGEPRGRPKRWLVPAGSGPEHQAEQPWVGHPGGVGGGEQEAGSLSAVVNELVGVSSDGSFRTVVSFL